MLRSEEEQYEIICSFAKLAEKYRRCICSLRALPAKPIYDKHSHAPKEMETEEKRAV